jgi:alpha-aminoadipic semialdehyde synthase
MSVDILPTQIPQDASSHFSKALMPYLRTLIRQYQGTLTSDDQNRVEALDRATIAQQGELMGVHKWLATPLRDFRRKQTQSTQVTSPPAAPQAQNRVEDKEKSLSVAPKKKVLLLGTGMVARPAVEEFSKRNDVRLVVGECLVDGCLIIVSTEPAGSKQQCVGGAVHQGV